MLHIYFLCEALIGMHADVADQSHLELPEETIESLGRFDFTCLK